MKLQEVGVGVGEKTKSNPIRTSPLLFCSYHGYLDPSSGAATDLSKDILFRGF